MLQNQSQVMKLQQKAGLPRETLIAAAQNGVLKDSLLYIVWQRQTIPLTSTRKPWR